jgi:hypothetical protein
MEAPVRAPVTIALVNDYDIVVMGIAHILQQYQDRVVIAELDTNVAVSDMVGIVLYDCFGQPESDHDEISVLVANRCARRVAVYTWNFGPELIDSARKQGVHGYLSKALPARAGRRTGSDTCGGYRDQRPTLSHAQHQWIELAGTKRGTCRPRIGDLGADHAGP